MVAVEPVIDYQVPRRLDVPDRIGIPFFTTAQVFILLGGIAVAFLAWRLPVDINLRAWLVVWLPFFFLVGPRKFGHSGWTLFQQQLHKLGRYTRPKRTIWRPE